MASRVRRGYGPKTLFGKVFPIILIGLVFLGIGIFLTIQEKKTESYPKTVGHIIDIVSDYDTSTHSNDYDVKVEYYVDEQKYVSSYGVYDASMYIGEEITVKYDPKNPSKLVAESPIAKFITLGIGAALILGGLIFLCKELSRKKKMKEQEKTFKDYQKKINTYGEDLENPKYDDDVVYTFGIMPTEYKMILKKPDGDVAYEILMPGKFTNSRTVEFVNKEDNKSVTHRIGGFTEVSYGSRQTESSFKFDGKNCWDYLHELGFRINTENYLGIFDASFDVQRYGMPYAKIKSSMSSPAMGFTGSSSFVPNFASLEIITREQNTEPLITLLFVLVNAHKYSKEFK